MDMTGIPVAMLIMSIHQMAVLEGMESDRGMVALVEPASPRVVKADMGGTRGRKGEVVAMGEMEVKPMALPAEMVVLEAMVLMQEVLVAKEEWGKMVGLVDVVEMLLVLMERQVMVGQVELQQQVGSAGQVDVAERRLVQAVVEVTEGMAATTCLAGLPEYLETLALESEIARPEILV